MDNTEQTTNSCPNGWGSRFGYSNRGCRCVACTKAQAKHVREWRMNNRELARKVAVSWSIANPERVVKYTRRYRLSQKYADKLAERIRIFNDIKTTKGCIDCGYNKSPEALHFDHVRGRKQCNVGRLKHGDWNRLLAEMSKCEIRCANCHAIATWRRSHGT